VPIEIIPPGTDFDFIGKRMLAALVSVGLILAGLVAVSIKGVNWGIDFAGGTEIQVKFASDVVVSDGRVREIVSGAAEIEDPSVVRYGEEAENEFLIKFRGALEAPGSEPAEGQEAGVVEGEETADRVTRIERSLAGALGPVIIERVDFVGPRVGAELRHDGLFALFWASVAILAYITFRFSSRFAPGAIVAVIHDLLITAGVFVILGLEFDLRILAAMLAILGYSLNDTIIIYDRIRENMEKRSKADLPVVLNQSVNQTLSRTVLTSGTTLAALLALFFLGGEVIRPFAFAMILGVIVGTYSSVFIAAPVLLLLERARV
jgi:preprotein translocase subunit SecF